MDERRRRQAAGRTDRTQSAREIDNNGQERAPRRRGWHTAGRVIGTILLVMVLTMAIFAGIFSAYINSSMRGNVEVYLDEFESKVSTELYYQEPSTVSGFREPHLGQPGPDPQEPAGGCGGH